MTSSGLDVAGDPEGISQSVAVGPYRLGVGPPVGTSISLVADQPDAGDERSRLSGAIKQDEKAEKRRGAVDDVQLVAEDADRVSGQTGRAVKLWTEIASGSLEVSAVNDEIDSLLALLQKLDRSGRFDEQFRLARALSRLLAVALRWLELLRSLRELLAAAERHGDDRAKAWALHELGTLHLAAGNVDQANRTLSEASELRSKLGDARGWAATDRNLQVLCRCLRQMLRQGQLVERTGLRKLLLAPKAVLVTMLVLAAGAGTAAIAAGLPGGGSHSVHSTPNVSNGHIAASLEVTGIEPSSGPSSGGTPVTISGTGLQNVRAVMFGDRRATNLKLVNDPQLIVLSPHGSGAVRVRVITSTGESAASPNNTFRYVDPPTEPKVTGVSPRREPPKGGVPVTVTGSGLSSAVKVRFGTGDGTNLKQLSDGALTITPSPGSGTVHVTVTTPVGTSPISSDDLLTYTKPTSAPVVTSVVPAEGAEAGATDVTVNGTNLGGASSVNFDGQAVTPTNVTDTSVNAVTPRGSGVVPVTVTTSAGTSQIKRAAEFTYLPSPAVTGVDPSTGNPAGGDSVTITGSNLGTATAVHFGGQAATNISPNADGSLTVTSPQGSGMVDVIVVTAGGSSTASPADQFTYSKPVTTNTNTGTSTGTTTTTTTTRLY